ncbi:hypothetical protein [Antrihabitans sp. YC2-6]|uniref:hypothetical protein n=1 Tax=Antrihabitans sp. YC2-6 TaxID=2799498 RepID=UPI0018F4DB3B|nr:hypothetical protein [Antrihabitans sp. YC2-6]MBJ8343931.1 hypothetical protein [Antrihabitans sp. YC2-6]
MEEDLQYKAVVTESGEQILMSSAPGMSLRIMSDGDPVVHETELKVSPNEFAELQKQAETNSISNDILGL